MNNVNQEDANPFGVIYLNLLRSLYKAGTFSQAVFTIYVSTRAGIKDWQFNESDIRTQTSLHRRLVKALCQAFVTAGMFLADGKTRNGSPRYKLNQAKFEAHLKGDLPVAVPRIEPKKWSAGVSLPATLSGDDTGIACYPRLSGYDTPRLSLPATLDCQAMPANKEEEKEECEKTDIHKRGGMYVSISQPTSVDSKADIFIKAVTNLQINFPESAIVLTRTAKEKAVQLFDAVPDLDPGIVFGHFETSVSLATAQRLDLRPDGTRPYDALANGEFDDMFWFKRSSDVSFFIKNYANVVSKLAERSLN